MKSSNYANMLQRLIFIGEGEGGEGEGHTVQIVAHGKNNACRLTAAGACESIAAHLHNVISLRCIFALVNESTLPVKPQPQQQQHGSDELEISQFGICMKPI